MSSEDEFIVEREMNHIYRRSRIMSTTQPTPLTDTPTTTVTPITTVAITTSTITASSVTTPRFRMATNFGGAVSRRQQRRRRSQAVNSAAPSSKTVFHRDVILLPSPDTTSIPNKAMKVWLINNGLQRAQVVFEVVWEESEILRQIRDSFSMFLSDHNIGEVLSTTTPSLQAILEDLQPENYNNNTEERLLLKIRRRRVFEDSIFRMNLTRESDRSMRIKVEFVREPAVDAGGPTREFFRLFFEECAKRLLMNGAFVCDGVQRHDGHFSVFGQLTAMALLHGCAGPRCFDRVTAIFITREQIESDPDHIQDPEIRGKLQQLGRLPNDEVRSFVNIHLPERFDVGYNKASISHVDRQPITEQFVRAQINKTTAEHQEYCKGLSILGMLPAIRMYPARFLEEFRTRQALTPENLEALFTIEYNREIEGNGADSEEDITMYWSQFLNKVQGGEVTSGGKTATLANVLAFATGSAGIPPMPFSPSPTIVFIHGDNAVGRKISANTCSNSITIPVNSQTKELDTFILEMVLSIATTGFGQV